MIQPYNLKQQNPVNSAANFALINPILLKGEIAFESDTKRFKVGDGMTPWNNLPYATTSNELTEGPGITITGTTIKANLLYREVEIEP